MNYIYSKKIKILFILLMISFTSLIQPNIKSITFNQTKRNTIIEEYSENKDNLNYQENVLIVKLESTSDEDIEFIEKKYSAKLENISDDLYTITYDENKYTMDDMVENLNADNMIAYAEPNYYFNLASYPTSEPFYDYQWALENSEYGVNVLPVWDQISTNNDVVVAIVDTGVNYNHEDLSNNIWSNEDEIASNGIDDDNNGYIDDYNGWNFADNTNEIMDTNGHGTHVAGIIGAETNGIGVAGIVPNVKLMSLKVISSDGNIYLSDVINAVNYAISQGVKIFNFSFGSQSYVQSFVDVLSNNEDALFISAAGNGGEDQIGDNNDVSPFYPASYNLDNIISVASTDVNGNLSSFSNYGVNSVDVAAPGEDIASTYYDGGYVYQSGTSMAAPFVTGTAAILYGSDSDVKISELKNNIINSVNNLNGLNGKIASSGIIDIENTYFNFENIVEFDGGDGSIANPYLISSIRQLNAIRNNLAASYKLVNDIDLDGYGWNPIGSSTEPFTGTLNGNGYKISNLKINLLDNSYVGLFSYVTNISLENPNIYNLELSSANISGKDYVGTLVGYGINTYLSNIEVTASNINSTSSTGYVGGIIGYAENSTISSSSVSGVIDAAGLNIGGIVGYITGNIDYSYSEADVYGEAFVGNIVGQITGDIQDVYSLGNVIGGLTLTNAGGIAGYIEGNLNNSYCLGMLKLDPEQLYTNVGLLVGNITGDITNSYYYNPYNFANNDLGNAITIENLYSASSYSGFDFNNNWEIGGNTLLPVLKNLNFDSLDDFSISSEMTVDLSDDTQLIDIQTSPNTNNRKNFLYTSQNNNIVVVDEFGNIKPVSEGTTIVDVYSLELNKSKSITINVTYNVKGDLNNDHLVTATDLIILRKYLAGLGTISSESQNNADINGDNTVTATDLVRMRRYLAGLEGM